MIRVEKAKEPPSFDELVRKKGLAALRELTGKTPLRTRPGPKRKKVAKRIRDIPAKVLPPYWTDALPLMLEAYDRTCAFAALRIEHVTGAPTVEHYKPKSRHPAEAYEWDNYRLVCHLLNSRKCDFCDVIDPFEVQEGWFALDLVSFACVPGPKATGVVLEEVEDTIQRLGLDGPEYKAAIEERYTQWFNKDVTFKHLQRWAPFLARELLRQKKVK